MKRTATVVSALALAVAGSAWADKPPHPTHPTHPSHPAHPTGGSKGSCTAKSEGYRASGTVSAASLTPGTGKGKYNGSLTVDVTKANHGAPTGSQTFTLTNARVSFGKGVTAGSPASGDRVTLHGKITALPHGCATTGFTPTVTVGDATIKLPHKHAH